MSKKVLILKVGALGDVVRTTYFLPGIRKKYNEEVNIFWITSKNAYDLLKNNKYIDKILFIESKEEMEKIKKITFDWIISLEDEEELYDCISEILYKKISGVYRKDNTLKYTEDLKQWFDMGLLSKYGKEKADQLKKINKFSHAEIFSKGLDIEIKEPYFFGDNILENQIKNRIKKLENYKIIGLNLNAGKRWPSKALNINEAKKLIKILSEDKKNFLFILGGTEDYERNKSLIDMIDKKDNVLLIEPVDILEFAAIIKNLDLLITSDTLALHLAIAQGIRTISYYAPTSAVEIDTFGKGKKIISDKDDYCTYKSFVDNSSITAEKILNYIKG